MKQKFKVKRRMPTRFAARVNHPIRFILCFIVMLVGATCAFSQSGRSGRTMPPGASPSPAPPKEEPRPTVAPVKPDAGTNPDVLSLVVVDDLPGIDARLSDANHIFSAFLDRLRDYAALDVKHEPRSSRAEAIKRAKTEIERFVVRLRIDADPNSVERNRVPGYDGIHVGYEVFAPRTAELMTYGRVFLRPAYPVYNPRPPNVTINIPSVARNGLDINSLTQAGRMTADRIMKFFDRREKPKY